MMLMMSPDTGSNRFSPGWTSVLASSFGCQVPGFGAMLRGRGLWKSRFVCLFVCWQWHHYGKFPWKWLPDYNDSENFTGAHRPSLAGTVQGERTSCQSQRVQRSKPSSCNTLREANGTDFPRIWAQTGVCSMHHPTTQLICSMKPRQGLQTCSI